MFRFTHLFLLAIMTTITAVSGANAETGNVALEQAINGRSAEDKARDAARHPRQTLELFQVEPGMTVAEALPGKGWYSNILANYLGPDGVIYGVNYPDKLWPMFSFATDEMVKKRIAMTKQFPGLIAGFTRVARRRLAGARPAIGRVRGKLKKTALL